MTKKWVVGVDIGGTKIAVGGVDAEGKLLGRLEIRTDVKAGAEAIQRDIVATVEQLVDQINSPPVGVGVGMAGQILAPDGIVKSAPNLQWTDVPLQGNLSTLLGMPVAVTNDVRAATWGEWKHGAGRGANHLICLFIGTGVGGGVVANGRMLVGATNTAGELGHITVDINGPECTCGSRGCLEALVSGWALAKRGQKASARDVVEAAKAGDPMAQKLLAGAIQSIAVACVGLVNAFNPEKLILGGGLGLALPQLVEIVGQKVHRYALKPSSEIVEVCYSELGTDAGVVGAAAFAAFTLQLESA